MKAHIARNQNVGIPLALGWNLSAADRGILEGMAPAFGMKLLLVSPADAGKTVAQLLGEVETKAPRTLVLDFGGVGFMDSSGIGLILGRVRTAALWGGRVTVRGLSPQLKKMAELSGVSALAVLEDAGKGAKT